MDAKRIIEDGKSIIGIELGSTRIKSVLIDDTGRILAAGGHNWENHLIDGNWTYSESEIWQGIQGAYQELAANVKKLYDCELTKIAGIGISGMMHGYMPFNKTGELLVSFRTWRNNTTGAASDKLSELFNYNIPQRWSIAHLYQSILNMEEHVSEVDFITTLAGYVHWKLTGQKVVGIGEASGIFPIDINTKNYNEKMQVQFNELISDKKYSWKIEEILPKVLMAGEEAGLLTADGAALLDKTGVLQSGAAVCPPEGDAGTGMVATNSVAERTGNISAGTSAFAMVVLEKELSRAYKELDMVTTPTGKLVAMSHANNCSTDINAWMSLFGECLKTFKVECSTDELYSTLFNKALEGDDDCGNLLAYCFYSGEHGVGLTEGCPMFLHPENANFNLANFIRVHLYTAFGAMKLGLNILLKQEKVKIDCILGHGGIFKTKGVAQGILASALDVPVAVMQTAGEGGAWGIALLAAYMQEYKNGRSLEEYLTDTVFKTASTSVIKPDKAISQGYAKFMDNYNRGLTVEKEAVKYLRKQ